MRVMRTWKWRRMTRCQVRLIEMGTTILALLQDTETVQVYRFWGRQHTLLALARYSCCTLVQYTRNQYLQSRLCNEHDDERRGI